MYEVEIKVELTPEEKDTLIAEFKARNFIAKGVTPQYDYYIEATKSPISGYDLKRYRNEAGNFIYTEKIWEMIDGQPARKENEHQVSESEFTAKVKEFPNALKIIKDREWFSGEHEGHNISITIDSVRFDHSPSMRYFVEAEIDVAHKEHVTQTKELITLFLKKVLKTSRIVESPGMFMMAFEKR